MTAIGMSKISSSGGCWREAEDRGDAEVGRHRAAPPFSATSVIAGKLSLVEIAGSMLVRLAANKGI